MNLVQLQDGIPIYLWRRSISFLAVREQAVSVRGVSRFFRECDDVYMENFTCHRMRVVLRERWSDGDVSIFCETGRVCGRDKIGGGVGKWCLRSGWEVDGSLG